MVQNDRPLRFSNAIAQVAEEDRELMELLATEISGESEK